MINNIHIENFTIFQNADLEFCDGINVFFGENGAGKSHAIKLIYSIATSVSNKKHFSETADVKKHLQIAIANKLNGTFKPEKLGRLVRRKQGLNKSTISLTYDDSRKPIEFNFETRSSTEVKVTKTPKSILSKSPVFLPTRELMSIYPGFVSLFDTVNLEFEETWRDTCVLLGAPTLKGPRTSIADKLMAPIEKSIGGKVELDKSGRFYLSIPKQGRMEMHLVAEGFRKTAMLARLISTGSLVDKGYLFWDEPETNLNPKLLKELIQVIVNLSIHGIQIFIATHSMFFIRELEIERMKNNKLLINYFSMNKSPDGTSVQQSQELDSIENLVALEEEIRQSERYLSEN